MWVADHGKVSIHNSGKTVKYAKSNDLAIAIYKEELHGHNYHEAILKVNYPSTVSLGYMAYGQYTKLIDVTNRSKQLVFKVMHNSILIECDDVLVVRHTLGNTNSFYVAVLFSNNTNSVTIVEKTEIITPSSTPLSTPPPTPSSSSNTDINTNILYRPEDIIDPLDKIVVVNYDKEELVLPLLSNNKILTIIRSFDSPEKIKNYLIIKAIPPCTINDKESLKVSYNSSINLCGIKELNKWFIV